MTRSRLALLVGALTVAGALSVTQLPGSGSGAADGPAATASAAAAPDCTGFGPGETVPAGALTTPALTDACLRLNQIQNVGTHNSYHQQVEQAVFDLLEAFDPALAASLEYSHPELGVQFGAQRARQIELDVFRDPDGGRYAERKIYGVLGRPLDAGIPALREPGLKVLHVQEVDYDSVCITFVECLGDIERWSTAHPQHLPIAVLIEPKDDVIPDPVNLGFVQPLPWNATNITEIDTEIRSVFDETQLITPDDVRGGFRTLEAAVRSGRGWPTLGEARGKVMFLLDGRRDLYIPGHPNLEGRAMFTPSAPGNPDAAFVKYNDPLGGDGQGWREIRRLVRRGYAVRTRSDADTVEARTGDTATRTAALRSGAQWVSTDYPTLADNPFGTGYFVALPRNLVARCNPIITGPRCVSRLLEAPTR